MFLRTLAAVLLILMLPCGRASAQEADGAALLQLQDARLAQIAERMMGANRDMCLRTMPLTGMLVHTRDQYGDPPTAWFAEGNVAIAQILPDSPAERAGIAAGDAIVAIGTMPVRLLRPGPDEPLRDAVFRQIAAQEGEFTLTLRRAGRDREVTLAPPRGCRALVEVLTEREPIAQSDGRVIQISYALAAALDDTQLPVTFAHELAHVILGHRMRLEEAGVKKGLLGEFGRNRRLNREVEVEADRLSVHLLSNAGYDPALAVQFWRGDAGNAFGPGLLRSGIYPSNAERAELMEAEIDQYLAAHDRPSRADHLLQERDRPL